MPLDKDQADELKSLIMVSRKRELSFGLALGKKPADTGFVLHRLKQPDMLLRQAKKLDGVQPAKSTCGTISTKGKTISLQCTVDPPPGLAKYVRLFLRELSMPMKVMVLGVDGAVFEQDDDEDEAADAAFDADAGPDLSDAPDADAESPEAQRWAAARVTAEPAILAFVSAGVGDVGKIRKAWTYACNSADQGDHASALKLLARILPLIGGQAHDRSAAEQGQPSSEPDPFEATWLRMEPRLASAFERVAEAAPANLHKLELAWKVAREKAAAGDFASATKLAEGLAQALKKALDGLGVAQPETATERAPNASEMAKRLGLLQDRINALDPQRAEQLGGAFRQLIALLKSGDLAKAADGIQKLEDVVTKLEAGRGMPAADEKTQKLEQALRALEAQAADVVDNQARDQAQQLVAEAKQLLQSGAADPLLKILQNVKQLLTQAQTAEAAWLSDQRRLGPEIERLTGNQELDTAELADRWNEASKTADSGNIDSASALVPRIDELLAAAKTHEQEFEAWVAAFGDLEPQVLQLKGNLRVSTLWDELNELAFTAKDYAQAVRRTGDLRRVLSESEGSASQLPDGRDEIPLNVVAIRRARIEWEGIRRNIRPALEILRQAIIAEFSGDDFGDVTNDTKALFDYIGAIDEGLEETLEALVEAPDAATRKDLRAQARRKVGTYLAELNKPFFADLDSGNGFVTLSLRDDAVGALAKVSEALR